jgi:hypothetical protein
MGALQVTPHPLLGETSSRNERLSHSVAERAWKAKRIELMRDRSPFCCRPLERVVIRRFGECDINNPKAGRIGPIGQLGQGADLLVGQHNIAHRFRQEAVNDQLPEVIDVFLRTTKAFWAIH